MVASEVPLNDIINNRDATGRIAKWAIELLPFDITYKPRRAIKSQVLADFVAERTEAELPKEYGFGPFGDEVSQNLRFYSSP